MSPIPATSNLSKPLKTSWIQLISRLLVRFKRVKQAPVEISQINAVIDQFLPQSTPISIPGGEGDLDILGVTLSIAEKLNSPGVSCLHAELLCNFQVKIKQSIIYNTHLMIVIEAQPHYHQQTKCIGVDEVSISELQLISDRYSIIKDTNNLLNSFLPKPLNSFVGLALSSTKAVLNHGPLSGAAKYLSLYTHGSKQKVLDYHRADIESKVIALTKDCEVGYRLDETDFEQKLFADFGDKIVIKDKQLIFVFKH